MKIVRGTHFSHKGGGLTKMGVTGHDTGWPPILVTPLFNALSLNCTRVSRL